MIDRDVEKSLDRRSVQIERQHSVRAGGHDQVGDELRRDRLASTRLLFLLRVAIVWDYRRDPVGGGAAQRIDDQEQFHQMMIDRVADRLNHEDIGAAHIFVELDSRFPILPFTDDGAAERRLQ